MIVSFPTSILKPAPNPDPARQVEEEDEEFEEEFVGSVDPSILHFLLASGDRISSKQARRGYPDPDRDADR